MQTRNAISQLDMLTPAEKAALAAVTDRYTFRVNEYYLGLINWADRNDPIRRIVIPSETELTEYGNLDPSREAENYVVPGCQHKYRQTALLLVSNRCDAYCRFCFRKRLFQPHPSETTLDISAGIAYITAHPEITNVLLTGGDPLVLSTRRLAEILGALRAIPHVRIIRLGTKTLAFHPFRILDDPHLLAVLSQHSRPDGRIHLMIHFDHPRELTTEARRAIEAVQQAGCTVVHQCPLLRGVNDCPEVLAELLGELAALGVSPYYLFQNRPVAGNAGFVVPLAEGYRIIESAKAGVSGLAKRVRYVMSHATGKVEVLAVSGDQIYLKYHQARNPADAGRLIQSLLPPGAAWLDDLPGFSSNRQPLDQVQEGRAG